MRTAERFGIGAHEPRIDYPQTRAHLRDVIAAVAPNTSVARLEAMNVKVIRAAARFTSKTTVEAGGFAIAHGGSSSRPALRRQPCRLPASNRSAV